MKGNDFWLLRERKPLDCVDWLDKLQVNDPYYHHCEGVVTYYDTMDLHRALCPSCGLCSECCSGHHDPEVDDPVSEG